MRWSLPRPTALLPSKIGRKAPRPGPPTTTSQATTGSEWKPLRRTLGLPRTACVLEASMSTGTAAFEPGAALQLGGGVGGLEVPGLACHSLGLDAGRGLGSDDGDLRRAVAGRGGWL